MSVCRTYQTEAMASLFEISIPGEQVEGEQAAVEEAFNEIHRVEQLLSRFDPASELARVNRRAQGCSIKADHELILVLSDCIEWFKKTAGNFDVSVVLSESGSPSLIPGMKLDRQGGRVELQPGIRLDLGGYGKGYALDRSAAILRRFRVDSALINGGTSSVLAYGQEEWPIDLRDPLNPEQIVGAVKLKNRGLSSSAGRFGDGREAEIIRPESGQRIESQDSCCIIAGTALAAEVL
jgi:thiamine biosynthesis lipoprotein